MAIHFVKKPIIILTGVGIGLAWLILGGKSGAVNYSASTINTELELAKITADNQAHISDNETQSVMASYDASINALMFQSNSAITLASIQAQTERLISNNSSSVDKYALTTDLLKTVDTNKTLKIIELNASDNDAMVNLNAQNLGYNLGVISSENEKNIAYKNADVLQTISLADIASQNMLGLDANAKQFALGIDSNNTALTLGLQEQETARVISNNDYNTSVWQSVSQNYANLLGVGGGGSGVNQTTSEPKKSQGMQYAKAGILAVGAVAAPFTGGASLAAATAATGAMTGAGL